MLGKEFIDDFREELVRYKGWIIVIGDDDTADAFCATVGVECVVCDLSEHGHLCDKANLPCSSTSCRCPGRVRSATVLLNRVMNSP